MPSLAEIEREVARRVGPFFIASQDSGTPTSSTATSAIMPVLQTNALLGGPENLWLLRRGEFARAEPNWRGEWSNTNTYLPNDAVEWYGVGYLCTVTIGAGPTIQSPNTDVSHWTLHTPRWRGEWSNDNTYSVNDAVSYSGTFFIATAHIDAGAAPPPTVDTGHWNVWGTGPNDIELVRTVDPADRQRLVQAYDPGAGRVIVERNWRNPMQPDEQAEFHHLDPTQELRVAVRAGLRRCFFEDTISVSPTGGYYDTDLTFLAPWLTDPSQVLRVESGYQRPMYEQPFQVRIHHGHVMLTTPAYGGAWVTALRPHWSWVDEADSVRGPQYDLDRLSVDLDYAAAAGHISAWQMFPAKMFAAAAGNLQATQEMAAREFTRQAMIHGPAPSREIRFSELVSLPL